MLALNREYNFDNLAPFDFSEVQKQTSLSARAKDGARKLIVYLCVKLRRGYKKGACWAVFWRTLVFISQ